MDVRHVCLVGLQSFIQFIASESKRGRLPEDIVVQKMMAPAEAKPVISQEMPVSEVRAPTGVTAQQTLDYQKMELLKQMNALEIHLSQGCVIAGVACDCCLKHSFLLLGLAEETVPIAGRAGKAPQVYQEIASWTSRNLFKMKPEGGSPEEYPRLAAEVGQLRKRLTA